MSVFNSVTDMFKDIDEFWLTRKWHWMSGDSLPIDWNVFVSAGSGSSGMVDGINEGFFMSISGQINAFIHATFADIRHYDEQASVFIGEMRTFQTANAAVRCGFAGLASDFSSGFNFAETGQDTLFNSSNFILITGDAGALSNTDTGVALDTSFHSFKTELTSTNAQSTIDGTLVVANKTTNLPVTPQQPSFTVVGRANVSVKDGRVRQLEAYST